MAEQISIKETKINFNDSTSAMSPKLLKVGYDTEDLKHTSTSSVLGIRTG